MTLPPVTLGEVRAHLNQVTGQADDEELWSAALTATELVESRCGPLRPRTVTGRVRPTSDGHSSGDWYGYGQVLVLPVRPVLSVDMLTDEVGQTIQLSTLQLDPGTGIVYSLAGLSSHWYTIGYTAGYDPVPRSLMSAVLVVAAQLWESQQGPASTNRFTGTADSSPAVSRGFAWPNRALQLIEPYQQLAV